IIQTSPTLSTTTCPSSRTYGSCCRSCTRNSAFTETPHGSVRPPTSLSLVLQLQPNPGGCHRSCAAPRTGQHRLHLGGTSTHRRTLPRLLRGAANRTPPTSCRWYFNFNLTPDVPPLLRVAANRTPP